jgi:hypothetical protein
MACEMKAIDYRRFSTRQLDALGARSRQTEQDFERRLDARLNRADLPGTQQPTNPDPVAMRLRFLLAKVRDARRAVERELAMRPRCGDQALPDSDEPQCEEHCVEAPPTCRSTPGMRFRLRTDWGFIPERRLWSPTHTMTTPEASYPIPVSRNGRSRRTPDG